jgi:hypothetical protein
VYSTDRYDSGGEVDGIVKVMIVELKHGGATLTRADVAQPEEYVAKLRAGNHVQGTTRFDVFVLGSKLAPDGADERTLGHHTVIRPMAYNLLLSRAHARTFNLLAKVKQTFPDATADSDVAAVVGNSRTLFDNIER